VKDSKDKQLSRQRAARDQKLFSRTNRIDGQKKWIKELFLYKLEQSARVVDLSPVETVAGETESHHLLSQSSSL
jgi:hypothetical protein